MREKAKIPEDILKNVQEGENFVLLTHVHPDGDALGSLFGLAEILDNLEKRVFCYLEEPVSYLYDFLPGCTRAQTDLKELERFIDHNGGKVVFIALDCGDRDRMGNNYELLLENHPFLVIDHHKGHKKFGDFRWVNPICSSTGEMVYELGQSLGAEVSFTGAYNLYVAISTDTGSFRYDATTPRTLRIAADLVELGVRPDEIAHRLYENFTLERLKLMELVLATLQLHEKEQVAFIHVTKEMLVKSGSMIQDVEGFIDYPRALKSVQVAVFLKESADDMVSVSLRAKGECDVSDVAKSFGGGGHRNASGFRCTNLPLEKVRTMVLDKLVTALR